MSTHKGRRVIIVGGGLGGLSAGVHLRLAGFDVAIYEAGGRVGGRANLIERGGFRFDTGPSLLNYPWVFEQLFAAAGRRLQDYVRLLPVEPSVVFRWEDGTRLALSSDLQHFLGECERLEPGCSPSVFAFLRDAEAKYRVAFDKLVCRNADSPFSWLGALKASELRRTAVWRTLDGELRRYFKSRHIREALGSYGMYLGGSPFELPGMFTILAYGELAHGLWLPKGGVYGLVEGVERLAREVGVEIHTNCRVRKILVDGGRVRGVELSDGSTRESPLVVSNVDVPTTDTELVEAPDELAKTLRARAAKTRMTPGVVTFYWGVRGRAEGLGHHTIFLPRDYAAAFDDLLKERRVPRELPFYVSVPSATDPDLAPAGDSALFVLAPVPLLSEMGGADWQAEARKIKGQGLATLARHGVALDASRIAVEEVYTPAEWRRRFGLFDGSAFGAAHTLRQLGPWRAKNFSADVEGLYYAGAGTTPGTGMPMVVLSGRMVAERVASHAL
ncbi:MAG TPA: phytoene desaturase family protein [Pyrinomonadaceae bacterium]|nr:phytoene desaturase family protein [Pyrinomonadaceae bacterium]